MSMMPEAGTTEGDRTEIESDEDEVPTVIHSVVVFIC